MAQEYDIVRAVPSIINLIELIVHALPVWLTLKAALRQHGFVA